MTVTMTAVSKSFLSGLYINKINNMEYLSDEKVRVLLLIGWMFIPNQTKENQSKKKNDS